MSLRSKIIAITMIATTLMVLLVFFVFESKSRILSVEAQWHDFNEYAAKSNYALARINTHFGYGGFIHYFKNYILHQTDDLLPKIDENLHETYHAIEEYRSLSRSDEETQALESLLHVVNIYQSKYKFARKLIAEGNTPREVEIHVQVNDTPALTAIDFLTRNALEQSRKREWETSMQLAGTISFIDLGALLIPVIALVAGLLIIFIRRIMEANQNTTAAKAYAESLVEAAPDAWLIVDSDGYISGVNARTVSMFGYSKEEILDMKVESLMPPRLRHQHVGQRTTFFAKLLSRPIDKSGDLIAISKDGREFPVEISLSHTRKNGLSLAIAAMRDVSRKRKAEQRLRLTQQVFEITAEPILITDSEKHILDMNDAFCRLTGYSREELMGQTPAMLSSGRHDADFYQSIWQSLENNDHWQGEVWNRHKDGEARPNLVTISGVKNDSGQATHFVATYSDISSLKENEDRLELLAHFDQLTSLPNRMLFHDRLRGARARAHRNQTIVAVMYVDLDGFKAVNDTLGHAAGDQLLGKVAAQLRACVREDDTVARLGGDEFAVLFNGLEDAALIEQLAERIVNSLNICVDCDSGPLQVSGSAGISIYPLDGENEDSLLERADQAMYEAKRRGKRQYCFYGDIKNNLG
ncbi:MAG TPA: GGDEF domain-containing protein [Gammaproteobacteria bacterium]|nr:GGDEF domain-containing protein [Gammaproteobacteria bacterium]